MRKTSHPISFLLSMVFLTGCDSSLLYLSNNVPIPLIKKQRETQFAGHYGTNGVNFQVVTSPVDNFAIAIAGTNLEQKQQSFSDKPEYHDILTHKYLEGELGYYFNATEEYSYEFFGGYGKGSGTDVNYSQGFLGSSVNESNSGGKYEKYFVQGNFGKQSEFYISGFGLRVSYIRFSELYHYYNQSPKSVNKNEGLFVEPTLFAKVGPKYLKIELQVIFPYPMKDVDFDYKGTIISLGARIIL